MKRAPDGDESIGTAPTPGREGNRAMSRSGGQWLAPLVGPLGEGPVRGVGL